MSVRTGVPIVICQQRSKQMFLQQHINRQQNRMLHNRIMNTKISRDDYIEVFVVMENDSLAAGAEITHIL